LKTQTQLINDQSEDIIQSIDGTMQAWRSADLQVTVWPETKVNLYRIGVPIVRGWYNFLVADHAAAKLIDYSFASQGQVAICVTNDMDIKMLSMYRDPNVQCTVQITAYQHPIISVQIDIKNKAQKPLSEVNATFQVMRVSNL
jgi:hypothetical protein